VAEKLHRRPVHLGGVGLDGIVIGGEGVDEIILCSHEKPSELMLRCANAGVGGPCLSRLLVAVACQAAVT
jgi:hypothetical protein